MASLALQRTLAMYMTKVNDTWLHKNTNTLQCICTNHARAKLTNTKDKPDQRASIGGSNKLKAPFKISLKTRRDTAAARTESASTTANELSFCSQVTVTFRLYTQPFLRNTDRNHDICKQKEDPLTISKQHCSTLISRHLLRALVP